MSEEQEVDVVILKHALFSFIDRVMGSYVYVNQVQNEEILNSIEMYYGKYEDASAEVKKLIRETKNRLISRPKKNSDFRL